MNTEELLKPRYKVIKNYPDCGKRGHFEGQVISFDKYDEKTNQWYNQTAVESIYDAWYDGYPHLFKKLRMARV